MAHRRRRKSRAGAVSRTERPEKVQQPVPAGVTSGGWTLLAHPLFLSQLERLTDRATREAASRQGTEGPATKLLGHILDLVFEKIPQDPGGSTYRHGGALGGGHKQWFRAKTGNGRFRLFFRFHSTHKIIVYAWLNDDQSLRTRGARTDAYGVFARMLNAGNPPDDWEKLVAAASAAGNTARLRRARERQSARKGKGI
ncbi:MAG: type II toxin-antitoxin system YhaV family toxin [Gemmatimonadaceae bacterium]